MKPYIRPIFAGFLLLNSLFLFARPQPGERVTLPPSAPNKQTVQGTIINCTLYSLSRLVSFKPLLPTLVAQIGVPVRYQLPAGGPLPKTFRVTLAIVDAKNPDWIVSQFACGVPRTVTAENGGKFEETWDGLDDNFMPVPPGEYGVKGIVMPTREWVVDQKFHSVTPRFVTGASTWLPAPEDWQLPEPFGGDPVGAPLGDVAVGANGVAVFYWSYLENGLNNPMIDLKKPLGYGQFVRSFNSGGAGGGNATATDGEMVWSFCNEGGMKYVYRADGKSFAPHPTRGPQAALIFPLKKQFPISSF